jgi:tRNA dimethylallyltransferase
MWADGLLTEVTALLEEGLAAGKTASTAIGYQQAIAQLAGELTEDAAIDATSLATRRLVRRQRSWFGPDPRITWLPADSPDLVDRAIAVIADAGGLGAPSTRA